MAVGALQAKYGHLVNGSGWDGRTSFFAPYFCDRSSAGHTHFAFLVAFVYVRSTDLQYFSHPELQARLLHIIRCFDQTATFGARLSESGAHVHVFVTIVAFRPAGGQGFCMQSPVHSTATMLPCPFAW
eukprot:scaffold214123_cov25-Tisochrysis_lutea.AAC.1